MKSFTVYHVDEKTFSDCTGIKHVVREADYCTNNGGNGLFSGDCIHQITGNGQFNASSAADIARYFDNPEASERCFPTKTGAKRYANKMNKKYPITKIPIRQMGIGSKMNFLGEDVTVLSQNGEDVEIEYNDEPGHTTTVKFYELI